MTPDQLRKSCETINIILTDQMMSQLETYAALLKEWNEKINLTAITETGEIYEKHFYDSLIPLSMCEIQGSAADVGTGAGFPGLVWKIARPDLNVSLIEPTGKRCRFLEEVIHVLKLENITVFNERAEEHVREHREEYDVVTARAVANMRVLSELCMPLVKTSGIFLAMKGSQGETEAAEAEKAVKTLGGSEAEIHRYQLTQGDSRVNLLVRKVRKTPETYPRNYGTIKKKPI